MGFGDTYPPGHIGQHSSRHRPWIRKAGVAWRPAPDSPRSTHAIRGLIEAADDADDLMAALFPE